MGYYSFYKIIKDIFRTIFGNKILKFLFIFLLIFFILFLFNNNVKASSDKSVVVEIPKSGDSIGNYNATLPSFLNNKYWFISNYLSNGNNVTLYYCDDIFRIDSDGKFNDTQGNYTYVTYYNLTWGGSGDNYTYSFTDGQTDSINGTYQFNTSNFSRNTFLWTNFDLKYRGNSVSFQNTYVPEKFPEIANTLQDLETLNFDVISVNAWDYSTEEFDILFYDRNIKNDNSTEGLYPKRVITLNQNTNYFQADLTADPDQNAIYWIPIDEIGLNLYIGGTYEIRFAKKIPLDPPQFGADYYYEYLGDPVSFTISSNVSQDKINALNKEIEDTTNKKYHDETINSINNVNNNINNLNNSLTNTTPDSNVSNEIDSSLNFDNQNQGLNNLNGGFFSRLTTMLSNLLGYNLGDDTSVSIPLPNSNKSIVLHSIDIYNNITGALRLIINAFWVYVFSFYMWKFINKIYIAVSTGNILDTFSSSGEAITNDML